MGPRPGRRPARGRWFESSRSHHEDVPPRAVRVPGRRGDRRRHPSARPRRGAAPTRWVAGAVGRGPGVGRGALTGRVVVCGLGAVGSRTARQLASSPEVERLIVVDREPHRSEAVARSLGPVAEQRPWHADLLRTADALVLAAPLAQPSPVRPRSTVPITTHLVEAALAYGVA